ncbi:MAG: hypothetical protein KatS3mg124_0332 [Porticoccaceae bacterium]|nr:MAG: hypothetical protein KatS3mg124_0332 [Porticoccaceae bacterium]
MNGQPTSPAQPRPTLEQQRAQDAWKVCQLFNREHVRVAKSLPALIMNSGLMQTLAFLHEKRGAHEELAKHLRDWLARRYPNVLKNSDFETAMEGLFNAKPHEYRQINAEAFAWLKWVRRLAEARLAQPEKQADRR